LPKKYPLPQPLLLKVHVLPIFAKVKLLPLLRPLALPVPVLIFPLPLLLLPMKRMKRRAETGAMTGWDIH